MLNIQTSTYYQIHWLENEWNIKKKKANCEFHRWIEEQEEEEEKNDE